MDQQLLQQLMQVFQQGLTLLQQAQQGGGMDMGDGGGNMPPGADDAAMGGGDDDMGGGDDDDMGGGGSLHDRVSRLEDHTGLKKSASGSLSDRVDALESELLGELYEGPMSLRVGQLEKAAGVSASPRSRQTEEIDAPDEIPLDSLIKSAIQQGISEGLSKLAEQQGLPVGNLHSEYPNPASMRKAASGAVSYGTRKASPPSIQSDAELAKAAAAWGLSEDDLDQPMTFGDILQAQYYAAQNGTELPMGDDDD